MKAVMLASLFALLAPYQCGTTKSHRPVEDTAPQALWVLAERFEAEGNAEARATTLQQLIDHYPSSRYTARARDELAKSGSAPAEPAAANAPETAESSQAEPTPPQ